VAILRQAQIILGGVHILQHPEQGHAATGEVAQRIGEGVLAGPAHAGEWVSRPARSERHKPIAAILGRPECRVGGAERVEGGRQVGRAGVWDVRADDRHPVPRETAECAVHALAQVAAALTDAPDPLRGGEMRPVGGHRQHCPKAAVGGQPAQQGDQRGTVEAECRPIPDNHGESALDRAESGGARKNDD